MKPHYPSRYYGRGALGAHVSATAAVLSPRPGGCQGWGCAEVPQLHSCEGRPVFGRVSALAVRVSSTQPATRRPGRAADVAAGRGARHRAREQSPWELQPGLERGRSASAQLASTVPSGCTRACTLGELRAANPQRRAGAGSWQGAGLEARQQHRRGTPAFLPGFPLAAAHASMG